MTSNSDIPAKVQNANLSDWYCALTDQDRVKLRRYLDKAVDGDASAFLTSVVMSAIDDHNYKFAAKVVDTTYMIQFDVIRAFDYNEAAVLAYFNMERYEDCLARCDYGLGMLKMPEVTAHVRNADGTYPEAVNCRNYKINVLVGGMKKYDDAVKALDDFVNDGLISAEEARYRKESLKTYRLQRTFEGIFARQGVQ